MNTLSRLLLLFFLTTTLSACVGVAINGSTMAVKSVPRAELEQLAESGNADAQYELGVSHCCMGVGFDTQLATEWLCRAADQGQRDAMYELGRIYMGEVSRTPAPIQKVLEAASAKESHAHAHYWLTRAVSLEQPDASRKLRTLENRINSGDLVIARQFSTQTDPVSCEYNSVFAQQS